MRKAFVVNVRLVVEADSAEDAWNKAFDALEDVTQAGSDAATELIDWSWLLPDGGCSVEDEMIEIEVPYRRDYREGEAFLNL